MDVLGREVVVDDPVRVGLAERITQGEDQRQHVGRPLRTPPTHARREVLPAEPFCGEPGSAAGAIDTRVPCLQDVRAGDLRRGLGVGYESRA
jgi:hypothetical protein